MTTQVTQPGDRTVDAIAERLAEGYSEAQITHAAALIARGQVHAVPGLPGTFVAESSDGKTLYLCDRSGACQCQCARKTGHCYHGLAAKALDATAKAAA